MDQSLKNKSVELMPRDTFTDLLYLSSGGNISPQINDLFKTRDIAFAPVAIERFDEIQKHLHFVHYQ